MLPAEALHLPFEAGPHRMALGVMARPVDDMLELDDRYPAEMAERRALLADRHADVFAARPGSEQARQDTLDRLVGLLPRRYPQWFRREGDVLHNGLTGERWNLASPPCDPLELAGRLVQEDLCLIEPSEAGPVLAAAVLCAPSRWRLADKIGRPLAAVHGPVPLYAERLSRPVDRLMAHLQPGKLVERFNWSVVDDGALFQVGGKHRTEVDPSITPGNAGERLFLRVERQTLGRVGAGGFVLFTIRVHSYPLWRVLAAPGAAARLAGAVRALPEAMAEYKSLPAFRAALLGYLEGQPS